MSENENAAIYFVDRHASGPVGQKPAFIEGDGGKRQITYAQLAESSDRMAALYAKHGINREDRAVLLALDRVETPVIFWGSLKAGVIPIPLNTMLTTEAYDTILRDSRARALFVAIELYPLVEPILKDNPYLAAIFVVGVSEQSGLLNFDKELTGCEPQDAISVKAAENAFWLYSSGSTGSPKGVRHAHGSLNYTADTYGRQVLEIEQEDVVYSAAKLFFAYGLGNAMTFPMSVGATTILLSGRPTPESVLEIINGHTPTVFCGVPTLYAALIAHIEGGKGSVEPRLRRCISAGEALPEDVGRNWENICGCEILDGVGSTEMLHMFLSNRSGEVVYGTSGVAVPGYDVRLVNEGGEDVNVGEIGELLVSGDSSASDYWNQRSKSRATYEGIWTRTGDKYEKTESGRLVYCGRTDDMFKVSGIWVSPFEVEQALVSHPSVLEAAVIPAYDEDGLEKPKAFVVLKDGVAADGMGDELKAHTKERIEKWKYPRWILIVEDLPKTATGKIQRFKLRD